MKTPKHTKGPWKVEKEITENGIAHVSIRGEPETHLFTGVQICKINYFLDCKNDLANAHLIAAAPEMYEALRASLKLLNDPNADEFMAESLIEVIENVLKKARGLL